MKPDPALPPGIHPSHKASLKVFTQGPTWHCPRCHCSCYAHEPLTEVGQLAFPCRVPGGRPLTKPPEEAVKSIPLAQAFPKAADALFGDFPPGCGVRQVHDFKAAAIAEAVRTAERGDMTEHDAVTMPSHYARFKIEPIRFIMENELPFAVGNVIKYCLRWDAKDGIQDLYKAKRYLEMTIKLVEGDPDWWRKPEGGDKPQPPSPMEQALGRTGT